MYKKDDNIIGNQVAKEECKADKGKILIITKPSHLESRRVPSKSQHCEAQMGSLCIYCNRATSASEPDVRTAENVPQKMYRKK